MKKKHVKITIKPGALIGLKGMMASLSLSSELEKQIVKKITEKMLAEKLTQEMSLLYGCPSEDPADSDPIGNALLGASVREWYHDRTGRYPTERHTKEIVNRLNQGRPWLLRS